MTEQELHRLSRKDLLELMLQQAKETEEIKTKYETKLNMIKTENEKEREILKKELEEAKKNLQNREIIINEAGSIAMAALQINGIFEAAQAAGQQYIENIRSLNDRQAKICAQRENESRAEADEMLRAATEKCEKMETECREKFITMEAEAKQRSESYWNEVSKRLHSFYENHQELKKLLNFNLPL